MKDHGIVDINSLADVTNAMGGLGLTPFISTQSLSGLSKSFTNEAIKALSDDEIVRCFTNARMSDKVVFLHEIQRRGIKSITIDLEGDMTDEKIIIHMETGSLFFGEPTDNSCVATMFKEETYMMERFRKKAVALDSLASIGPNLAKKKEPKFYQELNKNSRGKYRR